MNFMTTVKVKLIQKIFHKFFPLQEIVSNPKFFEDGVSSDDFSQGTLGNCWFVAACACLAEDSKLWKKVGTLTLVLPLATLGLFCKECGARSCSALFAALSLVSVNKTLSMPFDSIVDNPTLNNSN